MENPIVYFFNAKIKLKGCDDMSGKKGIAHAHYSCEEKLRIVNEVLQNHKSSREVGRENGLDSSMIRRWVRQYNKDGLDALKSKNHLKGNQFSALHTSKHLSDMERLQLTVEKLRVENERLKKGYIVKGVGADKEFVTLKDLNFKS